MELFLFGFCGASYVSICRIVAVEQHKGWTDDSLLSFIVYLLLGWLIAPLWLIYKFWEWLFLEFPKKIKDFLFWAWKV